MKIENSKKFTPKLQVKISKVEPSLDHPTLFSLKRLPSEVFIYYSGVFWSAPHNNFGGYFLETNP
jgi:hypothetical protein